MSLGVFGILVEKSIEIASDSNTPLVHITESRRTTFWLMVLEMCCRRTGSSSASLSVYSKSVEAA